MPLDPESFLRHTDPAEKTTIYTRQPDGELLETPALLIAQTRYQKLFITLDTPRRYVTHSHLPGQDEEDVEIDFITDYAEIEALLESAGLDGRHEAGRGMLYPNLLYLLMNP